jgi:hypothetical protein
LEEGSKHVLASSLIVFWKTKARSMALATALVLKEQTTWMLASLTPK